MPIYEYTCPDCAEQFEKLVRAMTAASERERVTCPKCGKSNAKRSMSVFAVGAEAGLSKSSSAAPGMCGRCGGPGPCANG